MTTAWSDEQLDFFITMCTFYNVSSLAKESGLSITTLKSRLNSVNKEKEKRSLKK